MFFTNFAFAMEKERILITGSSGFIGSFIVEEALSRDMEVWAAVRKSSSLQYLQDSRIHLLYLDMSSEEEVIKALRDKSFDYVVHAAGATKALTTEQFYAVNTQGTINLISALQALQMPVRRLVFISSLSVYGPAREQQPYTEIKDTDTPVPNTAYAKSKLKAEEWVRAHCTIPFVILRPTGVYGPREKDYMLMADSISKGIDIAAGFTRQDITFVFVKDVVQAVFLALTAEAAIGKAYFLSDDVVYTSRDFSDLIKEELHKRFLIRLTLPLWVLRTACWLSDLMMHITGKLSTLNNDHYNILCQRNWRCDITPAKQDLGYDPQWKLKEGVKEMLKK